MDDAITVTDEGGGVYALTLQRQPVNALTVGFLDGFAARLADLAADGDVRAVVLCSAARVFSAGLDLKEAQKFDPGQQTAMADALTRAFQAQFAFSKPLVVAVEGAAIAGGLFFVLAADWRVSGPRGLFGLAEVRVGADFPAGPMEIARATLDPNDLRRLMLTGQPISAEDAAARGIVDDVCAAGGATGGALAKARELADIPGATYARVKAQIRGPAIAAIEAEVARQGNDPERGWFGDETRAAMARMLG